VRRFVIATAGHVDHGKTTLVRALTGIETDRLPEEKRRGISIELGFAPWRVDADLEATIIDVPGHRRLVGTMIAGASGVDLVLLVVAADEGVMPQTREHARVCERLGIRRAVVALTKNDLVDAETMAMAEAEVRELLGARFELVVVPCSAARPSGLDELRAAVASMLRRIAPRPAGSPVRLWVDRVFSVRGAGTVLTGTLVSGTVSRDDTLLLLGGDRRRTVAARGLRIHERVVETASAPTRLAVNVPIASKDARRGELLATGFDLEATTRVDVRFQGPPLRRGAVLAFHVGTSHVAARVTRAESLDDDAQLVRLVLAEPRPIAGGDPYVLRGAVVDGGALAGGGVVLDARPPARSRREARGRLSRALHAGDSAGALAALLAEAAPRPLDPAPLHERLLCGAQVAEAARRAVTDGTLVACGSAMITRATLGELADRARALVHEHARAAPLDRGLPLATLQQKLAARAGADAAEAAIRAARAQRSARDGDAILVDGDVAVPASRGRLDPALARAAERAAAEIAASGGHGLSESRVGEIVGAAPDQARALLAQLERRGVVVRAGELWFAATVVEDLRARVIAHLGRAQTITVVDFKNLGGLPRNQAILLLEHFDQTGTTRRAGDARVLLGGRR
jgi:selenocysteine-specific elongation factor